MMLQRQDFPLLIDLVPFQDFELCFTSKVDHLNHHQPPSNQNERPSYSDQFPPHPLPLQPESWVEHLKDARKRVVEMGSFKKCVPSSHKFRKVRWSLTTLLTKNRWSSRFWTLVTLPEGGCSHVLLKPTLGP